MPGLFCPPRATPCWLHLASRAHSPHPGVILDSCPSVLPTPSPASPDKSACKACGAHQGSLLLCPCTSAPFHWLPASPLVLQCPLYAEQREASNPCAGYPPVCLKLCRLQSQTLITRPPWQPLLPAPTPPFAPFQYRRTSDISGVFPWAGGSLCLDPLPAGPHGLPSSPRRRLLEHHLLQEGFPHTVPYSSTTSAFPSFIFFSAPVTILCYTI